MRIAQVSKADSFGGGASRVASELRSEFEKMGHLSHHYSRWAGAGYVEGRNFPLYGSGQKLIERTHDISKKFGLPEIVPVEAVRLIRAINRWKYDLVHFHDLSSAISPLTVQIVASYVPTVWTFHDCSPFTGGCLYPKNCEEFFSGCGNCPQLGEWPIDSSLDGTRILRGLKARLHKSSRVQYVTPSHWMSSLAYSTGEFIESPKVISNGVDTEVFFFSPKHDSKHKLGLDPSDRTVLLSAGDILDPRKGARFAVEALKRANVVGLKILLAGNISSEKVAELAPLDVRALGYIASREQMADVYRAADVFMFPSIADNQPLAILESMACGTGVVGFDVGGIAELVVPPRGGRLVGAGDIDGLARGIEDAFNGAEIAKWSKFSASRALRHFSLRRHAETHLALYLDLFASKGSELGGTA